MGDTVIVKSDHISKALTTYQPNPLTIMKKKGSMITATHKGNQTTRNSSFFKKIPKPTTNPTHNLLDYSSSEDESHTHATTPAKPKDNQAQHTTLNFRRSGRTRQLSKRFDYYPPPPQKTYPYAIVWIIVIFFSFIQVNRHLLPQKVRAIGSSTLTTSQTEWTPTPGNYYYYYCCCCYHY